MINRDELFVDRLEFLPAGLKFFAGSAQLLVHGLEFLVGGLHLSDFLPTFALGPFCFFLTLNPARKVTEPFRFEAIEGDARRVSHRKVALILVSAFSLRT